jgi:hypothetical protein
MPSASSTPGRILPMAECEHIWIGLGNRTCGHCGKPERNELREQLDLAHAEIARMRAALESIVSGPDVFGRVIDLARAVLSGKDPADV